MECKVDLFSEDSVHPPQGGIRKTGKSCGGEGTASYEVHFFTGGIKANVCSQIGTK